MKLLPVAPGRPLRVAVFRALALGDQLNAVPALRALRAALPDARITLIGLPWSRGWVHRFSQYLDDFLEFPGYPGIPEVAFEPTRLTTFLQAVQADPFDLVIQLHGSGLASNPFCALLGARAMAGFYLPGGWCPDPDRFVPYPGHLHEARRYLALMDHLGAPSRGEELEFPLADDERTAAWALAGKHGLLPGRFACLHPGASAPARRWPLEHFAAVGDALAQRGLRVVLTGTPGEAPLTAEVAARMQAPAVDLAGRTSLGELGALLEHARLLVANDTGVSHLAAALSVPSVIVFLASDPRRWAPLDDRLHRVVGDPGQANACRHVPGESHRCLRDGCTMADRSGQPRFHPEVRVGQVLAEVDDLLAAEDDADVA